MRFDAPLATAAEGEVLEVAKSVPVDRMALVAKAQEDGIWDGAVSSIPANAGRWENAR